MSIDASLVASTMPIPKNCVSDCPKDQFASEPTRILVADSDLAIRTEKAVLLRQAGFDVIEARDDEEALEFVAAHGFHLALLNIDPIAKRGIEFCQRIKRDNPDLFILLTSSALLDSSDCEKAFECSADGYLAEPTRPAELLALIRTLLRLRLTEVALRDKDAHLRLAQDSADPAVLDWNIVSNQAVWSQKFGELFGLGQEDIGAAFSFEVIAEGIHPEDRVQVDAWLEHLKREDGAYEKDFRIVSDKGSVRWLALRGECTKGTSGRTERVLCLAMDITERKEAEFRNAQSAAIVTSSIDAIVSVDLNGTILTWNTGAENLFGYSADEVRGFKGQSATPRDLLPERVSNMQRILAGEAIEYQTLRYRKDHQLINVWIRGAPVRGPDGNLVGAALIIRDTTAQKKREERIRFLMRELTHRSKNLLAVIQAMARQSLSHMISPEEFVASFSSRLSGLAGSHDLLSSDDWEGASLVQLIRSQLQHYEDLFGSRILLEGRDIILRPHAAQNIGIALHELCSNAAKFGALSISSGSILISWRIEPDAQDVRQLRLKWEERDGPAVRSPEHKGFGHIVMDRIIGQALGGRSHIVFAPEGIAWNLDVPLELILPEKGDDRYN